MARAIRTRRGVPPTAHPLPRSPHFSLVFRSHCSRVWYAPQVALEGGEAGAGSGDAAGGCAVLAASTGYAAGVAGRLGGSPTAGLLCFKTILY